MSFWDDVGDVLSDVGDVVEPVVEIASFIPIPGVQQAAQAANAAFKIGNAIEDNFVHPPNTPEGQAERAAAAAAGGGGGGPSFDQDKFESFLSPQFTSTEGVDALGIGGAAADFNLSRISPTSDRAVEVGQRFNRENLSQFLTNREQIAPGSGEAISSAIDLSTSLSNFQLPTGFVNLIRSASASNALRSGVGFGSLGRNMFFSTLGTAGLEAALQGANLSRQIADDANRASAGIMTDFSDLFANIFGSQAITPGTAIESAQLDANRALESSTFNSELDFRRDMALAEGYLNSLGGGGIELPGLPDPGLPESSLSFGPDDPGIQQLGNFLGKGIDFVSDIFFGGGDDPSPTGGGAAGGAATVGGAGAGGAAAAGAGAGSAGASVLDDIIAGL